MGRIFETRKHTMFARWNKMSKMFTRVSKDIAMAVKSGGNSPESNPTLRRVIQNARSLNMPKDKIDQAIQRATSKDSTGYEEAIYEGYAPHGIAVLVVAATDNPTRTVANIRVHFNKGGGNLGNSGSVAFAFQKMGVFRLSPEGLDLESLELELIDHGLEEMGEGVGEKGDKQIIVRCAADSFGKMHVALEERKIVPLSSELEYIATSPLERNETQAADVLKLVDMLEQDDDVQQVFYALA